MINLDTLTVDERLALDYFLKQLGQLVQDTEEENDDGSIIIYGLNQEFTRYIDERVETRGDALLTTLIVELLERVRALKEEGVEIREYIDFRGGAREVYDGPN